MSRADFYRGLADLILVVHFGFVAFVVGGLVAVWLGRWHRWRLVHSLGFRLAHLLAMAVVLAETLGGMVCPLTTWEDALRQLAGQGPRYTGTFIEHWLHRLIFYQASEQAFLVCYLAFFALVVASFWLVPPRWPERRSPQPDPAPAEPDSSQPRRPSSR